MEYPIIIRLKILMVKDKRKSLFLLLAVFIAVISLFILILTKEKSDKALCQYLIEYLINPQNYSLDQTVEETNEFYDAFSEKYTCNFTFDNKHMIWISTAARQYRTVVTALSIKSISHEAFQIEEIQPPKYLSYAPQKTFLLKINYTYIDDKGVEYPITDSYVIVFYNDEIVYFAGIRNEEETEKGIMSYALEIEKNRVSVNGTD